MSNSSVVIKFPFTYVLMLFSITMSTARTLLIQKMQNPATIGEVYLTITMKQETIARVSFYPGIGTLRQ